MLQFRTGQVSIADLLQQRLVVENRRGELALAKAQEQVLLNQLAVLLGSPPDQAPQLSPASLGNLPPLPATGVQSNLIERRPDVRAAWLQVRAADQRVAAAVADRFPRLSLTGRATTSNEEIEDLFDDWLSSIAANLLAPPDGEVKDIASLQQTLRDWMEKNAAVVESTNLIVGFGYDQAQLAELRAPNRDDLDRVSSEVPIVVIHQSGHFGALNSKALAQAGITAQSEDPPGGVIRRQANGEPDGVLEENAFLGALVKLIGVLEPQHFEAFARAGAKWSPRHRRTDVVLDHLTPRPPLVRAHRRGRGMRDRGRRPAGRLDDDRSRGASGVATDVW